MENGFIKIHRKICGNPLSKKPNYFAVWIYLLTNANYKDKEIIWNNKNRLIKRSQFIGSIKEIANHFSLSLSTISYILNYLENEGMIIRKSNKQFTLFEICNYDLYQKVETILEINNMSEGIEDKGLESNRDEKLKSNIESNRNQIETTKNNKNNKNLYTHPLQQEISEKYRHVAKMEIQLSNEDCEKLTTDFTVVQINETLIAMENYKPLLKNNRSVNLTLRNWIKRRFHNNGNGKSKTNNEILELNT
jgi:hypothetical protein